MKVFVFLPDTLFRYGPFCYMHNRLFLSGGLIHLCMVGTLAMGDITAARAFTSGQGVGLGLFLSKG